MRPFEKFTTIVERNWDEIATYCTAKEKISLGFVRRVQHQDPHIPLPASRTKNTFASGSSRACCGRSDGV